MPGGSSARTSRRSRPAEKASPSPLNSTGAPAALANPARTSDINALESGFLAAPFKTISCTFVTLPSAHLDRVQKPGDGGSDAVAGLHLLPREGHHHSQNGKHHVQHRQRLEHHLG